MSSLNAEGYILKVSEHALISLTLNALEAYSVRHKNIKKGENRRLETFGNLYGHEILHTTGKTLYSIEIANTDTSSCQTCEEVVFNEAAIQLKSDVINSFWPSYKYLGDFHTHPYKNHNEVKDTKGYYFSKGDRQDLTGKTKFWKSLGHRLGLLVAIGAMDRAGTRAPQWVNSSHNTVEFTLGNYRLWLTGYASYYDDKKKKLYFTEDNDNLVRLDCTGLTGLLWEHERFRVNHND